ncbi:MAG TPA: DciA family protein [Gammaproteobacteria bacterium]|nr:DciA family protein [Gammaproteobacteria bacterium]
MKNSNIKIINRYFHTDSQELKPLYDKIKKLGQLAQKILIYLDSHLIKYCQVANEENGHLIILVENAAIATQLRFQTDNLLTKFKQDPILKHIKKIDYKVRPPAYTPIPYPYKTQKPLLLSPGTAELIKNIALTIKDPSLRNIMENIAKHHEE